MTLAFGTEIMAESNTTEELKDMSDPLAVYTRGGVGITNRGLNIKIGIQYNTDDANVNVMNVFEIKGIGGEGIGWDGPYERSNSVDSLRYRNFSVDKTNGRGTQIDVTYDLHSESGVVSYSLLQGLPKWKNFNLYPLAGVGLAYANNALQDDGSIQSGLSVPGALAVVGMYGKYTVNDKIWLNYNPFWTVGLVGSDLFMDHGFEGHSSVLTHEATVSYKLTPRSNVRYYGNWSQYIDLKDGAHRIEYNYQF
jgi:hypothetical protein